MKKFSQNQLPALTKSMYVSYQKWSDNSWKGTLASHAREIDNNLKRIVVFDAWKKILKGKYKEVSQPLVPEIFMDSYLSIHFVCLGLYKQANVCSRAAIETALRLVYFSTHEVEYKWWYEGNEWYLSNSKDVWGKGYTYFEQLEEVKKFDKELGSKLFDKTRTIYRKLSKYVHSGVASFQTSPDRISPKYKAGDFRKWSSYFKEVQSLTNVILILGFPEVFKALNSPGQREILRVIDNRNSREALRRSLELRLRGRI